jgi:hypothetical protein
VGVSSSPDIRLFNMSQYKSFELHKVLLSKLIADNITPRGVNKKLRQLQIAEKLQYDMSNNEDEATMTWVTPLHALSVCVCVESAQISASIPIWGQ